MTEDQNDIENLSPYKLIDNFSKSRLVPCIVLALAVHVAVIGGTSVGYIYDTWIDAKDPAQQGEQEKQQDAASGRPDAPASPEAPPKAMGTAEAPENQLDKHKHAPVVKKITETAKPEDIPKEPGDLGITIEETND